ncbi:proline iminopeptidase [Pelistega indica]|uniref:Proline iminopeptidase n=1 Tax=Pelistega indica TaxID=1414851 RepID=V8FWB2_9BURK|nr:MULTISPECIES: prolyl aminopeptidase [Pelistega]ETD67727.1 proline iminopeptidase [Pelistega indica]
MLYPTIEPYKTGYLDTNDGHSIYWELCGNPNGKPVIFLHGGPGAGCTENHRRLFNPEKYHIMLFDQRGCGRSLPYASLENNTTWHLVEDINRLRNEILAAEKAMIFGGSWGSTLALAYAETYPEHVSELIIRGIFTARKEEIRWFYQEGASYLFPDYWEDYVKPIPENERHDLLSAFHRRLTGQDETEKLAAASAWGQWEGRTITLLPDQDTANHFSADSFVVAFARIENHYFMQNGFFEDNQLINNVDKIRHIPCIIIQGRYDACTPVHTAWELHRAWPEADFQLIHDAGHAFSEPGIMRALIDATDKWADKR